MALGRYQDAADAYSQALSDGERLPTVDQSLLRWKLIDLPAPDEPGSTEAPTGAAEIVPDEPAPDESLSEEAER